MPNKTTNYGLTKPLPEEFYNIEDHNGNMDIIDGQLKALSEKSGVVIGSDEPEKGEVWIDTDDESGETALQLHTNDKNNPHGVTAEQVGAAKSSDFASHANNKSNPHGVTADQVGAATVNHNQAASTITAGTFPTTDIKAKTGTDYTTARIRNIKASTTDLTAGSSSLASGDIYLVYE